MPVYPIPDDWDGETWGCVLIDWPLSEQWFGMLRGLITTPVRGRFWDGKTGSIIDAQNIGLEIEGRNPVVSCQDITDAILLVNETLLAMDLNVEQQVLVQTDISNNVTLVANAVSNALALQTGDLVAVSFAQANASASAFAWSQSMAQNLIGVNIINNTEAQFRPIEVGVDPPPEAIEAGPTGITSTLEDTDYDLICRRVYWLLMNGKLFFNYIAGIRAELNATVLAIMGVVADSLWVAALRADPASKRFLIPAAVIINFAHTWQGLLEEYANPIGLISDWLDDEYQSLTCNISMAVEGMNSTDFLRQMILTSAVNWGMAPSVAGLAMIIFNYSALAALYYVSPLLDPAPPIPASEPANICTACGG